MAATNLDRIRGYYSGMEQAKGQAEALFQRAFMDGRELSEQESNQLDRLRRLYSLCKTGLDNAFTDLNEADITGAVDWPVAFERQREIPEFPAKPRTPRKPRKTVTAQAPKRSNRRSIRAPRVSMRSEPEEVVPPAPLVEVYEMPKSSQAVLVDEIDRRERAYLRWSPWALRARASRRYEGFGR